MPLAMFYGMITGLLTALGVFVITARRARRKGEVVADERTVLINGEAASSALLITGAFAFLGWIADNLWSYQQGGEIRAITPWSLILLVMVAARRLACAYAHRKHSVDQYDEATRAQERKMGLNNLLIGLFMTALTWGSDAVRRDRGLFILLVLLQVAMLGSVIYLLVRSRRKMTVAGQ